MATEKTNVRTEPEEAEPNTLKDQWGRERPWDGDRYPETSAAREGHITKPSGQGGATPKSRPDHQDQFPKNHQAPESVEYGELLARKEQGEDVDLSAFTPTPRSKDDTNTAADREARTARNTGSSK